MRQFLRAARNHLIRFQLGYVFLTLNSFQKVPAPVLADILLLLPYLLPMTPFLALTTMLQAITRKQVPVIRFS